KFVDKLVLSDKAEHADALRPDERSYDKMLLLPGNEPKLEAVRREYAKL
ncbi:hypothetical protein H0O03_02390, partial [Candidatus Micrarchaeota archaeon]|nr:hypothetical protein [Candidatus Micrarchaeota archaeon]